MTQAPRVSCLFPHEEWKWRQWDSSKNWHHQDLYFEDKHPSSDLIKASLSEIRLSFVSTSDKEMLAARLTELLRDGHIKFWYRAGMGLVISVQIIHNICFGS
ncbi:hypothetical protein NDU88_000887 [Pleurodeles waltl]|uniref:Uncharacterized protein n=1 Tax=Pleurodeles waltl TaxID=8319 RepID=A0AAV7SYE0_PLEWA|nr:hypothetical protein NDU88_000887 [Pleurodeles waltl]